MGSGVVGGQESGVQASVRQGYLGEVRAGEGAVREPEQGQGGPDGPSRGFPAFH